MASDSTTSTGFPAPPFPALEDPEGARVPLGLPPVIDAHVHLFPDRLFDAIWGWFDTHAWPIRYRLYAPQLIDFLLSRGVEHLVALIYAHKPGIAAALNRWMAAQCADQPQVTGLATVLPGEPGAKKILDEAFALGLAGVKIHCHVQAVAADAPEMDSVYRSCLEHDRPLVIHAGREPSSPAYGTDPHSICSMTRVEKVLKRFPELRICVPHLGADEEGGYGELLGHHENLWLDTTMVLADYFNHTPPLELLKAYPERIMYGTDFPYLPYAWDRELRWLANAGLPEQALRLILGDTARTFFRLDPDG